MSTQNENAGLEGTARGRGGVVRRAIHRKSTWILGVPVLLVVVAGGGMFAYNQHLNANTPPPLSFGNAAGPAQTQGAAPIAPTAAATVPAATTSTGATAPAGTAGTPAAAQQAGAAPVVGQAQAASAPGPAASGVDGRWTIGAKSIAGYRFNYSSPVGGGTRVGRNTAGTNAVTGEFRIAGTTLKAANFSVEMSKVDCDGGSACTTHINQLMDVTNHPYETFALASPVDLHSIPADGKQIVVTVKGHLTLRGVTRSVSFPLTARRNAGHIEVLGTIPVNRDDYQIPDSGEPGFDIDKNGKIELLLVFDHHS